MVSDKSPVMRVGEFLPLVLDGVKVAIPVELGTFSSRISKSWLQIYYWIPQLHYEVWLGKRINRIEIGLHFEGCREFSYRWAELLAARMPEVQAKLGSAIELEEWTASWARVHQTLDYGPLNVDLAAEVARQLSRTIVVLQPILCEERRNVSEKLWVGN